MNTPSSPPLAPSPSGLFTAHERIVLAHFARQILPPGGPIGLSTDDAGVVDLIERVLTGNRVVYSTAVRAMLWFLEHGSVPFRGKAFTAMDEATQRAYLERWAESWWYIKRAAFRLTTAMVMMTYYHHPSVKEQLGYGNE